MGFKSGGGGPLTDIEVDSGTLSVDEANNIVGIGTITPGDYNDSADNLVVYEAGNGGITIATGVNDYGTIYFADGTSGATTHAGAVQYHHGTDKLFFGTAGTDDRVTIDSSGNTGIGVTDPDSKLEVFSTTIQQKWSYDTDSWVSMTVGDTISTLKLGSDASGLASLVFAQTDGIPCAQVLDWMGTGGFGFKRQLAHITGAGGTPAIDFDEKTDAELMSYSGAVITLTQFDGTAITLPTASSANGRANMLKGWHIRVILVTPASETCKIVTTDPSNDSLTGHISSAASGAAEGVLCASDEVEFVDDVAAGQDYVEIICTGADATNTYFHVSGMAST
jgi:hypothetical protein